MKKSASGKRQNNINWKGKDASYFAKHMWMVGKYGNPAKCQECGVPGRKTGRMWSIHWCNISGKFKRVLSDWKQLCVSCHRKFDYGRGAYHERGSSHRWAKLKEKDVLAIRAEFVPRKYNVVVNLAKKYGVSKGTIQAVVRRANWKHI